MHAKEMQCIIQTHVGKFREAIGYTTNLTVSDAYFPFHPESSALSYPNAGEPGCYVFVGENKRPLYVGKANRTLGTRIWSHFGRVVITDSVVEYPDAVAWLPTEFPDLMVFTIPVCDEHWWLAAALEGYLVEKLETKKCRQV